MSSRASPAESAPAAPPSSSPSPGGASSSFSSSGPSASASAPSAGSPSAPSSPSPGAVSSGGGVGGLGGGGGGGSTATASTAAIEPASTLVLLATDPDEALTTTSSPSSFPANTHSPSAEAATHVTPPTSGTTLDGVNTSVPSAMPLAASLASSRSTAKFTASSTSLERSLSSMRKGCGSLHTALCGLYSASLMPSRRRPMVLRGSPPPRTPGRSALRRDPFAPSSNGPFLGGKKLARQILIPKSASSPPPPVQGAQVGRRETPCPASPRR